MSLSWCSSQKISPQLTSCFQTYICSPLSRRHTYPMGFFWEVTSLNLSISCHGDVVCWKVKHLHVTENPELHLKSPRWLAEPALWHRSVLLAGWCSPQTVSMLVSEINFRRKTRSDWQYEKLQASNISVHLPATPLTLCRCGQEAGSPWSVTGRETTAVSQQPKCYFLVPPADCISEKPEYLKETHTDTRRRCTQNFLVIVLTTAPLCRPRD